MSHGDGLPTMCDKKACGREGDGDETDQIGYALWNTRTDSGRVAFAPMRLESKNAGTWETESRPGNQHCVAF